LKQRQKRCDRAYLKEIEAIFKGGGSSEFFFSLFWRMYDFFGPQYWWPGENPFEIAIGAILTQNTAWKNVEKAITNLKSRNCLTPTALLQISEEELARLLRPAGYYNIKAGRLKNFVRVLLNDFGGDIEQMAHMETMEIRTRLLEIKGIGPETADSIILYALNKPSFVVDAYTFRILQRHDIIDDAWDYGMLRDFFMENLPESVCLFNEFHALFVMVGKTFCKSRRPICEDCPLQGV